MKFYKIMCTSVLNENGNVVAHDTEFLTKSTYLAKLESLMRRAYNYNGISQSWKTELENDYTEVIYFANYE